MDQFASLFHTSVPASIPGFELADDDRMKMQEVWPAGEDVAEKVLPPFMQCRPKFYLLFPRFYNISCTRRRGLVSWVP
jgi:hypothetical protein